MDCASNAAVPRNELISCALAMVDWASIVTNIKENNFFISDLRSGRKTGLMKRTVITAIELKDIAVAYINATGTMGTGGRCNIG